MARLGADLEDLALLAAHSVRAARVGELEGWSSPELKLKICAAAFVDVDFADLAAGEAHGGDWVDCLGDVEASETFGCGIAESSDGEGSGKFCKAAEGGAGVGGFALLAFEGVVDGERYLAAERKGEALADTEVGLAF